MKKLKLINSIMVTTCAVTPMCALASCSKEDYSTLAQEIRSFQRDEFMNTENGICKQKRDVWFDGNIYNHVVDRMKQILDVDKPAGFDKWSRIKEVRLTGESELNSTQQEHHSVGEMYPLEERAASKPYGNVWFDIEPSPGHENDPGLMIQAHMDAQMEWASDSAIKDWIKDGIVVDYNTEYDTMSATPISKEENVSSLGADAGAGMALMFALAQYRDKFVHGPIRLMFTCDESGSISNADIRISKGGDVVDDQVELYAGAELLKYDQLYGEDYTLYQFFDTEGNPFNPLDETSKRPFSDGENPYRYSNIINLDALVNDSIYIASAGIHECQIDKQEIDLGDPINWDETPTDIDPSYQDNKLHEYEIKVQGLWGGHSAEDINKGYANAFKLLNQMLAPLDQYFRIISIQSTSTSAYRIPNNATIRFVSSLQEEVFGDMVEFWENKFKMDYIKEKNLACPYAEIKDSNRDHYALSHEQSIALCYFTEAVPFGPQAFIENDPSQVQTSVNIGPAVVTPLKDQSGTELGKANVDIHTVVRSSKEFDLQLFSLKIHGYADTMLKPYFASGDEDIITDVFNPVWEAKDNDKLTDIATQAYRNIGVKPTLNYCHGWLESACLSSFLKEQKQQYHLICLGPLIYDNHTTKEVMYFDTYTTVINAILYTCNHINEIVQ